MSREPVRLPLDSKTISLARCRSRRDLYHSRNSYCPYSVPLASREILSGPGNIRLHRKVGSQPEISRPVQLDASRNLGQVQNWNVCSMYVTSRSRINISGATILAVSLFATAASALTVAKSHLPNVVQPDGNALLSANSTPARVGKIEIPAVGLATRVLEGDDAPTLRLAVGHIPGTAVPGPSGNVGLAGHRTTYFRRLRTIKVGDEIRFSTASGTFEYRVVSLRVVLPSAIEVLNPTQLPSLTLVTCYPFDFIGTARERLIVHAEMVQSVPN